MPATAVRRTPLNINAVAVGACIVNAIDLSGIASVSHLRNSIYHNIDVEETLRFFTRRYVEPLKQFVDISKAVAVDCAAGYGWFGFAYLLAGGKEIIAVDMDSERLDAACRIAELLQVDKAMRFIRSPLQEIPLRENGADVFVTIETLEHVGRKNVIPALKRIKEIASQAVIITTPNKLFPVIAHDTQLPFAHWLPPQRRGWYAEVCGRAHMNHRNEFLSPFDLDILREKFRPASRCLTFQGFADYQKSFPYYQPYGNDADKRWIRKPGAMKAGYYRAATALTGRKSYWVLPTMARIFIKH